MAVPDDAAQGGTITVMTSVVPATLDPTRAYADLVREALDGSTGV